jgi:hypothetical protein
LKNKILEGRVKDDEGDDFLLNIIAAFKEKSGNRFQGYIIKL